MINILEYDVVFDISGPTPTIKLINRSVGTDLGSNKWYFEVTNPNGLPIHAMPPDSNPDITGDWSEFTLPENIIMVGGSVVWSGNPYIVTVRVTNPGQTGAPDNSFPPQDISKIKSAVICKPNGNQPGTNLGKGAVDMVVRCEQANVLIQNKTNFSYRDSLAPSVYISNTLTFVYGKNDQGVRPADLVVEDFTSALVPISYSAPGYEVILYSKCEYDLGNGIYVIFAYSYRESFSIQCNVDLCQLACAYDKLIAESETNCDPQMTNKLSFINAKMNMAIMGKMQPLCQIDVAKLVEEIKELGGFDCDCNCGNGIVPIGSGATTGIVDCNDVMACINDMLNNVDPKCVADPGVWTTMTVTQKFGAMITKFCTPLTPQVCTSPEWLTFDIASKTLKWKSSNSATSWYIEYGTEVAGNTNWILYTLSNPIMIGGNEWQIVMSGISFQPNHIYKFRVRAMCTTSNMSDPIEISVLIPTNCPAIVGINMQSTN